MVTNVYTPPWLAHLLGKHLGPSPLSDSNVVFFFQLIFAVWKRVSSRHLFFYQICWKNQMLLEEIKKTIVYSLFSKDTNTKNVKTAPGMLTRTLIFPFLREFPYQEADESDLHCLTLSGLIKLCAHFHKETTGGMFYRLRPSITKRNSSNIHGKFVWFKKHLLLSFNRTLWWLSICK